MKEILVIDDSKTQLMSLKLFFSKQDINVLTAENALDGYKTIVEHPPDLVLCDVMMPNLNGYQFARLLKTNPLTQKIPIILLTSLNHNIDRFWSKQAGADLFLSKNCELNDLLENINAVIANNPIDEGIKKTIINTPILKTALQSKINDILDTSLMEATIMNEFRKLTKNIENSEKFFTSFFYLLSSIFNYNLCMLYFYDKEFVDTSKIYYSSENFEYSKEVLNQLLNRNMNIDSISFKKIETNQTQKIPTENLDFQTQYCLDVSSNGRKMAKLCFLSYEKLNYEAFQFFDTVKNEIALIAQIRNLYVQTKYLSITDGLTSLYNRRYFFENVEREYARVLRYKSDLSVAMLDIDFFKNINDKYGHQAGDAVLMFLSKVLVKALRRTDLIFRYGGEEIIILLPETSLKQAYIPLERIREYIHNTPVEFNGQKIPFTVSIGIADMLSKATNADELVSFADKALYSAKASGRNKVVLYE